MQTIRNSKLFEKIVNSEDMWNALFKDDIGCNGKDNSFVIRKEMGN